MRNLHPGSWYAVNLFDNDEDAATQRACVPLDKLSAALPHGSGIDGDYTIHVYANGAVLVSSEYHAMSEHGYYCGWHPFRFKLYRATADKHNPLIGPSVGYCQLIEQRGAVYMRSVTGGRPRSDDADYLHETIYFALRDADVLAGETFASVECAEHRRTS